jgi:GT2 family glycosyltransferase
MITRTAYREIGGMDEQFVGWGGEDVEFWERAQTRKVWNFGFIPLIHLWHASQPGKTPDKETPGMLRLQEITKISPEQRIRRLCALEPGNRV